METIQSGFANKDFEKVRKYSGYARHICTALLALFAAGVGFLLLAGLRGTASASMKYWFVMLAFSVVLTGCFTWLLRRLFGNLAHGEIFSIRNVECIRRIAFLFAGIGAWRLFSPLLYKGLVANQLLEPVKGGEITGAFISNSFMAFAVAGILLLASWIMQVGLGMRNEADELKREAELVV